MLAGLPCQIDKSAGRSWGWASMLQLVPPQILIKRANVVTDRASDRFFEMAWFDALSSSDYESKTQPQLLLRRTHNADQTSHWFLEVTLPWCPRGGPQSRHFQKHRSMVPPQVLLRRANIITDRASDRRFEIAMLDVGRQMSVGLRRHSMARLCMVPPQVQMRRVNIITDRISDSQFESLSAKQLEGCEFGDSLMLPLESEDIWELLAQRKQRPRIRRGERLMSPHFKVCLSCRPQLDNVRARWASYAACPHRIPPSSLPMMPADAPPLAVSKKLRMTNLALVRRGERTKKKKGLARCVHGLRERACVKCKGCPHGKLKSRCGLCRTSCIHGKYIKRCGICSKCPHGIVRDMCKECRGSCEHGALRLACRICSGCPHGRLKAGCRLCRPCPHGRLRINCSQCKNCGHGKVREHCAKCNPCQHGAIKNECVRCNGCPHGKLPRFCKLCKPCPHGRRSAHCPQCAGCSHGLLPSNCKHCSGCPHGRVKRFCRECNPCPHGKRKQACLQCSACPHGKIKSSCAQCKSCPHGKVRRFCNQCNGCPHGKLQRFCAHCKVAKQPKSQ